MTNRNTIPHGRAAHVADLVLEVCLGVPTDEGCGVDYVRPAPTASSQRDSGPQKRLAPTSQGPRTAFLGSTPHTIRVPMHLIRVPRG